MAPSNEEIVRRFGDVVNRSTSVDAVMAELEPFMDPEIEYVNPADAVERGTRKGVAGMRTVHARGGASGAEAIGPPVAAIYTFRDGRVRMIEWHYDIDEARARFEQ